VTGALLRYRIAAYVVGVLLLLLCVAMYLKYAQDDDGFMWIAMIHGYFYLIYLGLAFDLYRRVKWPVGVLVAMILAGLVPGMVFVVERRIVHRGLSAAPAPRDAGVPQA
jgi:integral membrane protein